MLVSVWTREEERAQGDGGREMRVNVVKENWLENKCDARRDAPEGRRKWQISGTVFIGKMAEN